MQSPNLHTEKSNSSSEPEPIRFIIKHIHNCPVYLRNEIFELKHNSILPPSTKPLCFPLAATFKEKKSLLDNHRSTISFKSFLCGGCKENSHSILASYAPHARPEAVINVISMLHQYSFFRLLPEHCMMELYDDLSIHSYEAGTVIIAQGTPASSLFMVISGEVEIIIGMNDTPIGHHGAGGIFGETSILCDSLHTASIRTTKQTRLIQIDKSVFNSLLVSYPALQRYFYMLLAKRLTRLNLIIAKSDVVEMRGKLSEWPLPDLLQTINMNHKSGKLELTFDTTTASVEFYNGNIIGSSYLNLVGSEAFYALFTELGGTFDFIHSDTTIATIDRSYAILGDFMSMIMEGLVRADEAKQA